MYKNDHPEAQWFKNAGLGLFIHYGIGSLTGVDLSWSMMKNKPWFKNYVEHTVPPEEYWKQAEKLNPINFNPDKWLAAAREAGMEYAVLTTKHHEGFAFWPTEYGNYGVNQYLDGRDIVGEYVDACRRQGLKVGLYFSLSDWHYSRPFDPSEYSSFNEFVSRKRASLEDLLEFEHFFTYVKGQIKELITRYGKIDIMWFDHFIWNDSIDNRMNEIYTMIRTEQPHILINDRGGDLGDFKTPECQTGAKPVEGLWEACYIWQNGGWGYNPKEDYRDINWTLKLIASVVSGGGNLLLNVGPRPDGEFPDVVYKLLDELKEWMRYNRPSIKAVERAPWPPKCNQPMTKKPGISYIHVLNEHNGPVIINEVPEPVSVKLLRNRKEVEYNYKEGKLQFQIASEDRASGDEVVAVTWPRSGADYDKVVFKFAD